jgi:sulfonate transport system ATP-binding protein
MAMSVVQLSGVGKRYGDLEVLRELDFEVAPGEFVAVTGRSGCGKSTLLRLIARLSLPTTGSVTASERLAIAFQEPRLVPWISVEQNVTLGLGLPRAERHKVAVEALADVQIAEKAKAWPLSLSGGQAQRVSLARALVRNPELLLLDEPFGSLDAITRCGMQELVTRLRAQHGFSVVMVTHDVAEAVKLADRVVVIADGGISHEAVIKRDTIGFDGAPIPSIDYEAELAEALH